MFKNKSNFRKSSTQIEYSSSFNGNCCNKFGHKISDWKNYKGSHSLNKWYYDCNKFGHRANMCRSRIIWN